MRVLICGLGYVGSVTAACLLADEHHVVASDTDGRVLELLAAGESPVDERGVRELLARGRDSGRLSVSDDFRELAEVDIALVCVGTEAADDGSLNLGDLEAAVRAIGTAVRARNPDKAPLLIAVRSTILPGTMAKRVAPTLEAAAGERPGVRYCLAYNPEFMREGSGIRDFRAPSRIVIGGPVGIAAPLLELYRNIAAPYVETSFEVAEAIKFADNSFHAMKVAFANEIGRFAVSHNIDATDLAEVFMADTKLNLSDKYLRPGMSFGGPCLEKDLKALVTDAQSRGVDVPLLEHVLSSNQSHEDFLLARVVSRVTHGARLLLVGITFKPGSGDLRGSPLLSLARRLVDAGHDLTVHDPDVSADAARAHFPGRVVEHLSLETEWDLVIFGKPPKGGRMANELAAIPSIDLYRL